MDPEHSKDEALSRLLSQWKVETGLPPRFQEGVWNQIERAESSQPRWTLTWRRLAEAVARPSLATSYVTALLLIGAGAGYWRAQVTNAQLDQSLGTRYVQMIDPYQMPNHR